LGIPESRGYPLSFILKNPPSSPFAKGEKEKEFAIGEHEKESAKEGLIHTIPRRTIFSSFTHET